MPFSGFGNIGGIIATYSFLPTDAPYYRKGYIIALSFICLAVVATCLYAASILSENKKKDKSVHDVGLTDYEKTELGVSLYFPGPGRHFRMPC